MCCRVCVLDGVLLVGFLRQVERSLDAALHLDWNDALCFFLAGREQRISSFIDGIEALYGVQRGYHDPLGSGEVEIAGSMARRLICLLCGAERLAGSRSFFVPKGLLASCIYALERARILLIRTEKPNDFELISGRMSAYNAGFELKWLFWGNETISRVGCIEHAGSCNVSDIQTVDEWANRLF